jgi:hypothetical protein
MKFTLSAIVIKQFFIVSKGGAETWCPQTFIVKVRIPVLGRTSTFYSGMERRGNRLVARETEKEGVCVTLRCLKMMLASIVKRPLGKGLP